MSIRIQRLSAANSDLLDSIGTDVFDNPIDPVQLRSFLDDERHVMYLAVDAGSVVGMASAFEYFHPDKKPQLFINEVGVAATHRREGIGRSLVEALLGFARERKCVFAWLGTDADNQAGQACFGSVPEVENAQPFLLYEWHLDD